MTRPLRIEYEGALYHVTARGNEQRDIFLDAMDREKFLYLFDRAHLKYGIFAHGYVLMTNHYHLIPETPEANLSATIHYLNGTYTTYFNRKYNRVGHLFQGRYKSILVDKDSYLMELSRYIHLNSVRAGVVSHPEEYKWSSYNAYVGKENPPRWLYRRWIYEQFSLDEAKAIYQYKKFIEQGLIQSIRNPLEETHSQAILGNGEFRERISSKFLKHESQPEVPSVRQLKVASYDIDGVVDVVSDFFDVSREVLMLKRKRINLPRSAAIYLCYKYTPSKLRDLSSYFGGVAYSAVSKIVRKVEEKRGENSDLDKKINAIEKILLKASQ